MIKALQKLVGETPYFVTMVELESDRKFMILGQNKVFFVDNSLRRPANQASGGDDFDYSSIKRIRYWRSHENFIKLELSSGGSNEHKQNEKEEKLIICEDASNLINSLKCYW